MKGQGKASRKTDGSALIKDGFTSKTYAFTGEISCDS